MQNKNVLTLMSKLYIAIENLYLKNKNNNNIKCKVTENRPRVTEYDDMLIVFKPWILKILYISNTSKLLDPKKIIRNSFKLLAC